MPLFELEPMDEAIAKNATWKNVQMTKEYLGYIDQLKPGFMGRLQPGGEETVHAVRRRLGVAARSCGKDLVIQQADHEVYSWIRPDGRTRRSRGGRRRSAAGAGFSQTRL